ncbi:transposase [Novosphingobium subterraneum]|uniref:transposase n=1 Tax=Novosphingobium subterraneum TaxID=48936 RepID=UPI003D0479EB
MRRIDELHLALPFAGSRMLRDLLRQQGIEIGRQHDATLMKKMVIEAIYRRPNMSKPVPGHKIYPYLLRKLPIARPNQVWATNISYIPMARGFVYLVANVDWFSRKVLAHRVSITIEAGLRVEALEGALARYGKPDFHHRSRQSTYVAGVHQRAAPGGHCHLHGRPRRWRDNVVVERPWRSVKYEEVYLRAYAAASEARASIGRYLALYNTRRPHSRLAAKTPD